MEKDSSDSHKLMHIILAERDFRMALFKAADQVFNSLAGSAKKIIDDIVIHSTAEYPIELHRRAPGDMALLLGRHVIHVNRLPHVAVQKRIAFIGENKPTDLFRMLSTRPAHQNPSYYTVAIEFTRASSWAYRQRLPGTALVFAVLYVGLESCYVEQSSYLQGNIGNLKVSESDAWAPVLLEQLLSQVISSGLTVWPGVRSSPYEQLLLLPEEQRALSPDRKIGFVPPTIDKDPING